MSETATDRRHVELSWLPSWVDCDVETIAPRADESVYALSRPRRGEWPQIADGLRHARAALADVPIAEIVDAIDETAARWADPSYEPRARACASASEATGFSREVVDRSFDAEMRNYRADSLWRTLRRELGDPGVLDRPTWDGDLGGLTRAIGTGIAVELLSSNVPGLPALGIVRALLSKSALIAKVAGAEPTFAAAFARELNVADSRLGDALLVTYWARDDLQTRDAVFAVADTIIAYGGREACASARGATRAGQRFIEHGHRLSIGIVSRAYLAREGHDGPASRVARDVSMFNQAACIAPQAYFVEGEQDDVASFGGRVAGALERYARDCPRGALRLDDAAAEHIRRAESRFAAAGSAARRFWAGRDWTVTVDEQLGGPSGNRMLRIVPAPALDDVLALLRPHGSFLQNVAVGAVEHEMPRLVSELALLGVSRICEPGAMPDPSLMWRHDGRMALAELIRWCDVEMHPWSALDRLGEPWPGR